MIWLMSSIPSTLTKGAKTLLKLTDEMKIPLQRMHQNLKLFLKEVFPNKKGKDLEKLTKDLIFRFYSQVSLMKIISDGRDKGLSFEEIAQSATDKDEHKFLMLINKIMTDIEKAEGGE